jgi:hypothetical protein
VCFGLAFWAVIHLKETFGESLDYVE